MTQTEEAAREEEQTKHLNDAKKARYGYLSLAKTNADKLRGEFAERFQADMDELANIQGIQEKTMEGLGKLFALHENYENVLESRQKLEELERQKESGFGQMRLARSLLRREEMGKVEGADDWACNLLMGNEQKALHLDKKPASAYLMAQALRDANIADVAKWFSIFRECRLTGCDQDIVLLLFAIEEQIHADEIQEYLEGEINVSLNAIKDDPAGPLRDKYIALRQNVIRDRYPTIEKHVDNFSDGSYMAKGNLAVIDYLEHLDDENDKDLIKLCMDALLERPGKQEKALAEQIQYHHIVIECNGDKAKADEIFQERMAHDGREFDMYREMVDWMFDDNIDSRLRKRMFKMTKRFHEAALKQLGYNSKMTAQEKLVAHVGDQDLEMPILNEPESYFSQPPKVKLGIPFYVAIVIIVAGIALSVAFHPLALSASIAGAVWLLYQKYQASFAQERQSRRWNIQMKKNIETIEKLKQEYLSYLEKAKEYVDMQKDIERLMEAIH